MLNNYRRTWPTDYSYRTGKSIGVFVKVVPSATNFSAIANRSWTGLTWLAIAAALIIAAPGAVLTALLGFWLIGLLFFIVAPLPILHVTKMYFMASEYKYEDADDIVNAESYFIRMSLEKQKEYKTYLEAIYKKRVNAKKAIELFKSVAKRDSLELKLDDELSVQQEVLKALES